MTDAMIIQQLRMVVRSELADGRRDERDYVVGRIIRGEIPWTRECVNGVYNDTVTLCKLYETMDQTLRDSMKKGGSSMWYATKFGCGHLAYPIEDIGGGYVIGKPFIIERVILDQKFNNIPNAVYYGQSGKQYKEADLFTSPVDAQGEVRRRTRLLDGTIGA